MIREPGVASPSEVLVLATLGAPERRLLRTRRARRADPEPPPAAVTTGRATVIETGHMAPAAADAWLEGLSEDDRTKFLAHALRVLDRALAAHRVASADLGVPDARLDRALAVRIGHGRGEQVADGRWSAAVDGPPAARRRRRAEALRPQERLAALLAGRDHPLACEDLALRARMDLDAGRMRQAALQLRVALEAGLAELGGAGGAADMAERLDDLRDARRAVGEAANAALQGDLGGGQAAAVAAALERLEAALRAHAAHRT